MEDSKIDVAKQQEIIDVNVSKIMIEVVEKCLGSKAFNAAWISRWESNIASECLVRLRKLEQPYKYIVSCTIMQKNGGELHTAHSCFWDTDLDTSCTIKWENKFMYCIVSIFCLAI